MSKFPEFETLDDAVAYWETHDTGPHWDEMEAVEFEVDLHKDLLHPNLIVLTHRADHRPGSQQDFEAIEIEYVTIANGQLLIIRDIPALQCSENGKKYILEETLDKVEQLLELEREKKLQPSEMLSVPVFSLNAAA